MAGSGKKVFQAVLTAGRLAGLFDHIWPWIASLGAGAVLAWAAKAVKLFATYAPFSYVAAALLGFFLVAMALAGIGMLRVSFAKARLYSLSSLQKSRINPMDDTFTRERIAVSDLVDPSVMAVEQKTFVGCELVGPGNIITDPYCLFSDGAHFPGCDLIMLPSDGAPPPIQNSIIFRGCSFRRCKFMRLTIMMPPFTAKSVDDGYTLWTGRRLIWLYGPPRTSMAIPPAPANPSPAPPPGPVSG